MIVVADNEFTSEDNEFRIGEVEYEMVELLRRLNINRPVALTLACLSKGEEISSQRIEMVSGLRQPEVSIAMRYLRENDWVDMREEKKNQGKGRPVKLYKLTVRMETIINSIEEDVMAESKAVLQNIERLKNLSWNQLKSRDIMSVLHKFWKTQFLILNSGFYNPDQTSYLFNVC